jgi:preprotein translocase subunit YajC
MHTLHTFHAILAATTATTTSKSSKGSSSIAILFILILFVGVYFFFIRPRQQRLRQQQSAGRQLGVGDAVVTAGGIYGKLIAVDDQTAEVEVAPGMVLSMMRRAVSPRPDAPAPSTGEPVHEEWPIDRRASGPGDTAPTAPGAGGPQADNAAPAGIPESADDAEEELPGEPPDDRG